MISASRINSRSTSLGPLSLRPHGSVGTRHQLGLVRILLRFLDDVAGAQSLILDTVGRSARSHWKRKHGAVLDLFADPSHLTCRSLARGSCLHCWALLAGTSRKARRAASCLAGHRVLRCPSFAGSGKSEDGVDLPSARDLITERLKRVSLIDETAMRPHY